MTRAVKMKWRKHAILKTALKPLRYEFVPSSDRGWRPQNIKSTEIRLLNTESRFYKVDLNRRFERPSSFPSRRNKTKKKHWRKEWESVRSKHALVGDDDTDCVMAAVHKKLVIMRQFRSLESFVLLWLFCTTGAFSHFFGRVTEILRGFSENSNIN